MSEDSTSAGFFSVICFDLEDLGSFDARVRALLLLDLLFVELAHLVEQSI